MVLTENLSNPTMHQRVFFPKTLKTYISSIKSSPGVMGLCQVGKNSVQLFPSYIWFWGI